MIAALFLLGEDGLAADDISASASSSNPVYDVTVETDVPIPIRKDISLMADLYFPVTGGEAARGRLGALLTRTPYNKSSRHNQRLGNDFASRGFVAVIQDEAGRYASPGKFFRYGEQAEDGYDTVEWIAAQPWSNGRVGTFGASTVGQNQNALATLDPPHLTAMIVAVAGSDYSLSAMRERGAFHMRFFAGGLAMNPAGIADPLQRAVQAEAREHAEEWLWRYPVRPGLWPFKHSPDLEEWFFGVSTFTDFPGPEGWWLKRGWNIPAYLEDHADVATVYIGSWFDTYALAQTTLFTEVSKRKRATPKRLIMHPLGHTEVLTKSWCGEVDFGEGVYWDLETFRLQWYDRFVKGLDNDVEESPPVKIFVMGGGDGRKNEEGRMNHGGIWRDEAEWPLARTEYTKFYFHSDGSLATEKPADQEGSTTYQYDPENPVPTVGGNQSGGGPLIPAGPYDQVCDPEKFVACDDHLPLETRHDIVVFKTPPLERTVEVTGPITVNLWASSDAPDTDFTAKLIDEYPPNEDYPYGFQMYLNKGIVRARYRNSRETQEFMEKGEVYPFTIQVYPSANRFIEGHRIVVHVSSSDFPEFDRNPNTGEPLGKSRMKQVAMNTLHHNARYPSHIILPVIPNEGADED